MFEELIERANADLEKFRELLWKAGEKRMTSYVSFYKTRVDQCEGYLHGVKDAQDAYEQFKKEDKTNG